MEGTMTKELEENAPDQTDTQEQTQFPPDTEPTVESVVEAVLFASDEPLSVARLTDIVGISAKQIREHIENLNEKYQDIDSDETNCQKRESFRGIIVFIRDHLKSR